MAKDAAPSDAIAIDLPAAALSNPFSSLVRSARIALEHPLLRHPAFAIAITAVLFALSECVKAGNYAYLYQFPTAAFADLPAIWFLNRFHLAAIVGPRLATSITCRFSLFIFLLDSIVVIAIARRWPKARDTAAVYGGTLWLLLAAGWNFTLCMLLTAACVHFCFRKLNSHLSMLFTTALLVLTFKYFIPARYFMPARMNFLAIAAFEATRDSLWCGALRLVMYAFEASSVQEEARSFWTVLAYSPLGLFLWPANPLASYLMYATPVAQGALDRQGSRQLYRSGFKYLILVGLVGLLTRWLPQGSSFSEAPLGVRVLGFIGGPFAFYLRLSLTADFAFGLSSLAGFHVADSFNAPFLAENPINFWQNWQIPVVSFLRRAFIFPVSRRKRSLMRAIAAGMAGSVIFHAVMLWLRSGPRLTWASAAGHVTDQAFFYTATGLMMLIGAPFYEARSTRKLPVRILLIVLTQLAMGWLLVGMIGEICPGVRGLPSPINSLYGYLSGFSGRLSALGPLHN